MPGKTGGFFLEIGALDGVRFSNTYALEKHFGWTGLLIEANPRTFSKISENRTSLAVNACLDGKRGTVKFHLDKKFAMGGIVDDDTDYSKRLAKGKITEEHKGKIVEMDALPLQDILVENAAPSEIDYMSIDIEGAETRVLMPFPFEKYAFGVISIERPTNRLIEHLSLKGYEKVIKHKQDTFFAHRELTDVDRIKRDSESFFGSLGT